jgi:large subunit ribosomal protein L20
MPRVKQSVSSSSRHKKVLKQAKGYDGARSRCFKTANQAVIKAGQYAYRDRIQKKRQFRKLWCLRINAAVRAHGLNYSQFIHGLKRLNIELDRKVLAEMVFHNSVSFNFIINEVKSSLRPAS